MTAESCLAQAVAELLRSEFDALAQRLNAIETAMGNGPAPARRLTTRELADCWQVSERHISNLRRRGLPTLMLGDSPRFVLVDCERWLRETNVPVDRIGGAALGA